MGVKAPVDIQRFYYAAYPVGLLIAFLVYYLCCLASAPMGMENSTDWKEPRDYVDEGDVARQEDFAIDGVVVNSSVEKGGAEKSAVTVSKEA